MKDLNLLNGMLELQRKAWGTALQHGSCSRLLELSGLRARQRSCPGCILSASRSVKLL